MERKITCYREQEGSGGEEPTVIPMPEEEVFKVAAAYEASPSREGAKVTFQGVFEKEPPQDIGGAGCFKCFETSMGECFGYMERFRGTDDLAGRLEEMFHTVDRLVNFFRDFLETKLGDVPDWDALRAFMDLELRRDVKNLLVYMSIASVMAEDLREGGEDYEYTKDYLARFFLYLVERDYVNPRGFSERIRRLVQLVSDPSFSKFSLLKGCLSRKLGVPENSSILDALYSLMTSEELEDSLYDYIRTLPEWEMRMKRFETEREGNPGAEEPEPRDYFEDMADSLFPFPPPIDFPFNTKACRIRIRFACPAEPLYTNGEWDEEKKEVRWSGEMWGENTLPAFAYVVWIETAEAFQKTHFERVFLKGEDLLQYVFWYEGLHADEAQEWDAFLEGLNPEMDLNEEIDFFRFSNESDENRHWLGEGRKMLVKALEKE